jgi:hypothetical protein
MEIKLYEWYKKFHDVQKKPVTAKMIKNKALEFSKYEEDEFGASKGWLEKFKKKFKLEIIKESDLHK